MSTIALAPSLVSIGGARDGIAPANLLDIQDVNGNQYYLADRKMVAPAAIPVPDPLPTQQIPINLDSRGNPIYLPWLLSVPSITLHRSLATDSAVFVLQNISGNTLARDVEIQLRASALQGAFFIYRCWEGAAEAPWLEMHGTLTLDPGAGVDTAQITGAQLLNPAQDDTPLEIYCETCQLQWAGPRCGSTQSTECLYSFQSCQVIERPMIIMNDFEVNYGETTANTPLTVINRSRRF
jgi:hypothetical protein